MLYNFIETSVVGLPLWINLGSILSTYYNRDINYISRIYSNIHAFINILSSVLYLLGSISRDSYICLLGFTFSYVIFDLRYLIFSKDYPLIMHHVIIIIALTPLFNNERLEDYYINIIAKLFLSEMSTIFLNNSWMMIKDKNTENNVFLINVYLTLINFFVFRIINISLIVYDVYYSIYNNWLPLILMLQGMNIYWFTLLFKKAKTIKKQK